jgi:hypothetical protein
MGHSGAVPPQWGHPARGSGRPSGAVVGVAMPARTHNLARLGGVAHREVAVWPIVRGVVSAKLFQPCPD